jgi:hypothetical protein
VVTIFSIRDYNPNRPSSSLMMALLLEPMLQLDNTLLSLALHITIATTRRRCHHSLHCLCYNRHHQSTMEPPIWATAMEMPTLVTAGSRHRDTNGETLSTATSGSDGERQVARRWDIDVVSLGVTRWTQASARSRPLSWNRPPSTSLPRGTPMLT